MCNVYKNSLTRFRDCEVAVKMLPSFADDIARADFNQVISKGEISCGPAISGNQFYEVVALSHAPGQHARVRA